jgi:hypothetical protein
MSISKDLFLAILAMDAYNRGYNAGIKSPDAAPNQGLTGTHIGLAKLRSDVLPQGYEAASFFAQAYELTGSYAGTDGAPGLTAGQTVISYRGTDDPVSPCCPGVQM